MDSATAQPMPELQVVVGIVQVVPPVRMCSLVVADHGGITQRVVFPGLGLPQDLRGTNHIQRQVAVQVRQVDALQVVVEFRRDQRAASEDRRIHAGALPVALRLGAKYPTVFCSPNCSLSDAEQQGQQPQLAGVYHRERSPVVVYEFKSTRFGEHLGIASHIVFASNFAFRNSWSAKSKQHFQSKIVRSWLSLADVEVQRHRHAEPRRSLMAKQPLVPTHPR